MASASTSYMRLLLRILYRSATTDGISLSETLLTAATARVEQTQSGRVLIASSGNGRSQTFTLPNDTSPMNLAETISELLDRYDEAEEKLGSATDEEIYDEMMLMLAPRDSYVNDYSGLRETPDEVDA